MKILAFLFYISCFTAFGQSYTVIHTIGEIYDLNTKKYLTKGMKISESTELRFDSKNARAAVLSSSRGRYIIQTNSGGTSQSDLAYTLSSVINPARGKLSTRAGGINNTLDFEKHFSEEMYAMVLGKYLVKVSPNAFKMSETQFFYAQYNYRGDLINKRLDFTGNTLIFDASSLYVVDETPINQGEVEYITIFYYNATTQESTELSRVKFQIVSKDDFQSIVSTFDNPENAVEEITGWITDLYGGCAEDHVRAALNSLE